MSDMSKRNCGTDFDIELMESNGYVDCSAVVRNLDTLFSTRFVKKKENQVGWLLRAITCIDLTTLCGDDSFSNVQRLCWRAAHPLSRKLWKAIDLDYEGFHTAAVCVYPARVADCKAVLEHLAPDISIASVAGGFPSGQYHLRTRLLEIEDAIEDGATEIDVVINRDLALYERWEDLYDEVKQMREVCGKDVHMKTILGAGDMDSLDSVYKASMTCMMAGADFIKTSTGKEKINATFPIGIAMTRAIKDYKRVTGFQVGFKPAGGIRTADDALSWQILMKDQLGDEWLYPDLFRIGASGLLGDIEQRIYLHVMGRPASPSSLRPFV